jgi:transposase
MAKAVPVQKSRESYWRQVIARWKRSGLSVRAFCRTVDLNPVTFYWWRRELKRRDQAPPTPLFLPVRVLPEREQAEPSASGIEVVLANGRLVRVGAGFDSQTLARVVALLEEGGRSC